jgi:DNA-binding transcriptional ArsR family regulator
MKTPIDWLFPPARKRVLALLLNRPDGRWHLRDVGRQTGLALGTVRRELAGLVQAEIVTAAKDGNRTYYQANRASPLFPELAGLMRKTAGLADVLREALSPLADKIHVAFLHGSQVGDRATAASDVDILVVGEATFGEVASALSPCQDRLGREINPTVYPKEEFRRKVAAGHHFLLTVLESPKVFLLGDERDLTEVAGRRPAETP